MPWSEYQESAFLMGTSLFTRTGISFVSTNAYGADIGPWGADHNDDLYTQYSSNSGTYVWAATQYSAHDSWNDLPWMTQDFIGMVQGVDYVAKPGSDPTDPYRFIDYDPTDAAEVVGWDMPHPTVVDDGQGPRNLEAFLWLDPHTNYQPGQLANPVIGAQFATIPALAQPGTPLPTPPDPGNSLSWTIGIGLRVFADGIAGAHIANGLKKQPQDGPVMHWRVPRFRYWIPGDVKKPALRLRQRDDNLFLNAGRIRNRSSRQTTNRLRSYD